MTTARQLIYDGLREGNIIPANSSLTATDAQNAELLPKLNSYLKSLLGQVIGEEPRDWAVPPALSAAGTPYWNIDPRERYAEQQPPGSCLDSGSFSSGTAHLYPPPNSRLIVKITDATTVFLPPSPDDGALMQLVDLDSSAVLTLDANGRFIDDADTRVLDPVSSFNGKTWFYRGDQGTWRLLSDFTIDSESPLPADFDDLLSIGVYFAAAPRYGSTPSPATSMRYKDLRAKLKRRYRQNQPVMAPAKGPANTIQEYGGVFGLRR